MTPVGVPGIDVPDSRGRTGLDRVGRDLTGNPDVVVRDVELLASGWHVLRRTTFDQRRRDGRWTTEQRETYDRGNGATLLPYDTARRTVLLTRQFRFPAYVNGSPDGMLVEDAAVKQVALQQARTSLVVADASKLGVRAFASVARLDAVGRLVTDSSAREPRLTPAAQDTLAALENADVEVVLA